MTSVPSPFCNEVSTLCLNTMLCMCVHFSTCSLCYLPYSFRLITNETYKYQVHDEVILEGPEESAEIAKDLVVHAMMHPFNGKNFLDIELAVDANFAGNWYAAK